MPASRHNHLKLFGGGYTAADATYGSATYGEVLGTYGQQPTQSALAGTAYELLPFPGWHPQSPAWLFRLGDTSRFEALVVDSNDPTSQVDVSTIVSAQVVIEQYRFDDSKAWRRAFSLTTDLSANTLYRDWLENDLIVAGRFRVLVRILFESGRYLTVEANDSVMMHVNDSAANTPTEWLGFWDYTTPAGTVAVSPGEAHQADDATDKVRLALVDHHGVDRTAQLALVAVGDLLVLQEQVWTITGVELNGNRLRMIVDPTVQAANDGIYQFQFIDGTTL